MTADPPQDGEHMRTVYPEENRLRRLQLATAEEVVFPHAVAQGSTARSVFKGRADALEAHARSDTASFLFHRRTLHGDRPDAIANGLTSVDGGIQVSTQCFKASPRCHAAARLHHRAFRGAGPRAVPQGLAGLLVSRQALAHAFEAWARRCAARVGTRHGRPAALTCRLATLAVEGSAEVFAAHDRRGAAACLFAHARGLVRPHANAATTNASTSAFAQRFSHTTCVLVRGFDGHAAESAAVDGRTCVHRTRVWNLRDVRCAGITRRSRVASLRASIKGPHVRRVTRVRRARIIATRNAQQGKDTKTAK